MDVSTGFVDSAEAPLRLPLGSHPAHLVTNAEPSAVVTIAAYRGAAATPMETTSSSGAEGSSFDDLALVAAPPPAS